MRHARRERSVRGRAADRRDSPLSIAEVPQPTENHAVSTGVGPRICTLLPAKSSAVAPWSAEQTRESTVAGLRERAAARGAPPSSLCQQVQPVVRRSKRWRAPWRVMSSCAPITPQDRPARCAARAAASIRPSASRRAAAAARSSASVAASVTVYLSSAASSNAATTASASLRSRGCSGLHAWSPVGRVMSRYLGRAGMAWMT